MRLILVLLVLLTSKIALAADLNPYKPPPAGQTKELCVCGYNPYEQCDGTYIHRISQCYDESGKYCGYHDEITGQQCGNVFYKKNRRHTSVKEKIKYVFKMLPCVNWEVGADYGYSRLFNKCDTCKQAWIYWSDGTNEVARMKANGFVDVRTRANLGRIFKEDDC
jgi:hypothetical protein